MDFILLMAISLVLSMIGIGLVVTKRGIKGKNFKRILGMNVTALVGILIVATIIILSGGVPASAQTDTVTGAAQADSGLRYIGAALSIGLSAIGSGIAVGATGSAALGALSEDSSMFGKAFVFVGLAEGIAIYGLIISILIINA